MVNKKINNLGAALITVMIVVFIVVAIISHLTITNYRVIHRLSNRQLFEQASAIAFGAIDFGRAGLATSGATVATDSLKGIWAQPLPKVKLFDDVYMSGLLVDEQGKFNLNDLTNQNGKINQKVVDQFSNLLSYINLPPSLAYNIAYYISAPQYQTDVMMQYTMSDPPSRPAGRPFIDLSELILVKGLSVQTINKMLPYITAIPVNNYNYQNQGSDSQNGNNTSGFGLAVNINTASAEVIAAKGGISLAIAQRIISARSAKTFGSNGEIVKFLEQNGVTKNNNTNSNLNIGGLGVNSQYFIVHAVVENQDDLVKWIALLYRPTRNGNWPQVLWFHPE